MLYKNWLRCYKYLFYLKLLVCPVLHVQDIHGAIATDLDQCFLGYLHKFYEILKEEAK